MKRPKLRHLCLTLPLAAFGAQAAPLVSSQDLAQVVLLPVEALSISDTSPDGAAPLLVQTQSLAFAAFDPSQGVLTGVSGQVSVDPGHALMAYRNESGGDWDSVAYVRTTWTLDGAALVTGSTTLQTVVANRDTPVVISSDWTPVGFTATQLEGFVGTGDLSTAFTTYLGAFIDDGGGGSVAIASILETTPGGGTTADADGLTATASWQYEWLNHAQLSFAAGAGDLSQALDLGSGSSSFTVYALGDGATTGADLVGWSCSGDCGAFGFSFDPVNGMQAGGSAMGNVDFLGGNGSFSAQYTLHFADDDAVGAAASRLGHDLVLDVSVTAVPEPGSYAMFLAGLGVLGLGMRRRRQLEGKAINA